MILNHRKNLAPIALNQSNLKHFPKSIKIPNYDRSKVSAGIVHIGVGGFHRAHQAVYIDDLLHQDGNESWGICGIGLRDENKTLSKVMHEQDNLYTLAVRSPNGAIENRVIGAMVEFIFAPENKVAVIQKLASPQTKVVSLTITEGGYNFNPATEEFDHNNPDIIHDSKHLNDPKTVFGYLTAGLKERMDAGVAPFSILSCDNIQQNGDITKKMVLAFINMFDHELAHWVDVNVSFPNSMVDRITPVTTMPDVKYIAGQGIIDKWPITCEAFTQWVIEDSFCNGRPEWDKAGAQFVKNVLPYEKMKIRLLNAGHSVLALLGAIHGYTTIDETIADPLFANYLREFMDTEVTPLLKDMPGINLDDYKTTLIERFANPNIKDALSRICSQSSAKLPKFLIATVQENLKLDTSNIKLAALVLATWCWYSDKQHDRQGKPLEIIDDMADLLHSVAIKTSDDPLVFLGLTELFGDLKNHADFCLYYQQVITQLYQPSFSIKAIMKRVLTHSKEAA